MSPQLLSAADGKCSSHPAVLSSGWLWQRCSCYSWWQGEDGGALGCCHSPVCPPCSWEVADQPWQKTGLKLLRENTQELLQPQCSETEWSISRKGQTVVFCVTSDVLVCEGASAGLLQHLSGMLWAWPYKKPQITGKPQTYQPVCSKQP